ncbi:MAG TPA: PspA/IM30 family protein, partial [Allocoleopsis sp.]
EAKTKKDMLKARAVAAKANEQLQNVIGNMSTSSAMGAFERMEDKVLQMEARSQAVAELAGANLESQFAQLESGDVDDELALMKSQLLSGGAPNQKTLTASPQTDTSQGSSVVDDELERLKQQLDELQ